MVVVHRQGAGHCYHPHPRRTAAAVLEDRQVWFLKGREEAGSGQMLRMPSAAGVPGAEVRVEEADARRSSMSLGRRPRRLTVRIPPILVRDS